MARRRSLAMVLALLRPFECGRGRPLAAGPARQSGRLGQLVLLIVAFGMLYGAVMGSFGAFVGRWTWQIALSAVKVPMLLTVTCVLALPSFFVINTLAGLRGDFRHVLGALIASQAAMTIALASLAPLTAFWYVSSSSYSAAILCNAVMFGLGSFAAQGLLRRHYRPLIARDRRHRQMLRVWLGLYAFVGIQMGWVLRPFIGDPTIPTRIFRQNAWGNAYVALVDILLRALGL